MARKTTPKRPKKTSVKPFKKRAADKRKPVVKKPARKVSARAMRWSEAEIEEAFRRFHEANPEPRGELNHVNPFTLLVAVVLSAQATDAGVNKATPALFAAADTPEKMAALGEERVRELIKTIGLYRTKAKNVVSLSQKLVAEHASTVPRTREELEGLPGVGRKTANVVLNIAFGEADDCGRHTPVPDRQPHGPCTRQESARSRAGTGESRAGQVPPPRPPLADPARPLHLRRAHAKV